MDIYVQRCAINGGHNILLYCRQSLIGRLQKIAYKWTEFGSTELCICILGVTRTIGWVFFSPHFSAWYGVKCMHYQLLNDQTTAKVIDISSDGWSLQGISAYILSTFLSSSSSSSSNVPKWILTQKMTHFHLTIQVMLDHCIYTCDTY